MKTISLKLPESLDMKLGRIARQRKQSKSEVVREALLQFLNGGRRSGVVTVAELAGDLLGSAEGPSDLATNPKYMEGYGK
jgi:Arc/MetJ-type ribon-helix-helix transcriptional regulator